MTTVTVVMDEREAEVHFRTKETNHELLIRIQHLTAQVKLLERTIANVSSKETERITQ